MPRNYGPPSDAWDFKEHKGSDRLRLRDHGNEIVLGLVLLHALEDYWDRERAAKYRTALFVFTNTEPITKRGVARTSGREYRLWMARNMGEGYPSYFEWQPGW